MKRKAFTLIEVVISVALFAMAATVLSSSFVNALLARDKFTPKRILMNDLATVRQQLLLEPAVEAAEEGASCETLHHGEARWSAEIEPTEVVDFFQVHLSIEFMSPPEGQAAEYQETFYLLRPTWSDTNERNDLLQEKKSALLQSRDFDQF